MPNIHQNRRVLLANPPRGPSFVGTLDDYTTALNGAWLPFRGFTDYAGAGWRIRDTDDDTEHPVLFNALGDPIYPTVVGNAATRWWYDQSPEANDLPQATAASQPFLTDNVLNGYPSVRFDGSNDEMLVDCGAFTEGTIYIIAKRLSAQAANQRLLEVSTSFENGYFGNAADTYQYYLTNDGSVIATIGGVCSEWNLLTFKYTSTISFTPFINGVAGTPVVVAGGNSYIRLCSTSTGDFGHFDVMGCLRYHAAHNDTTREAIEAILADKLGLTLP